MLFRHLSPRKHPLFKVSVALALGIFLGHFFLYNDHSKSVLIAFLVVMFFVLNALLSLKDASIYILAVTIGVSAFSHKYFQFNDDSLSNLGSSKLACVILCNNEPKEGAKSVHFEGTLLTIMFDGGVDDTIVSLKTPVYTFLPKKLTLENQLYGNTIYGQCRLKKMKKSKNPYSFDFYDYYKGKGIHFQIFFDEDWMVNVKNRTTWRKKIHDIRISLIVKIKSFVSASSVGLILGIFLGYKDLIDPITLRTFSETGSTHLLAVSGLHVGILSVGLRKILDLLPYKFRYFKLITLLFAISFYASLTGLSPSVLRASIMFGVLEVGKLIRGQYFSLNSVGFSLIVILLISPYQLFQLGFQLSYSAVISIVIFYPLFYRLCNISNKLLNKGWQMLCLACSAQILIFPLLLYYFHQFSFAFIIGAIPSVLLAGGILISTIAAVFIVSIFPILGFLFRIPEFFSNILRLSTNYYSTIPHLYFDKLFINEKELIFIFLTIFLIVIAINSTKRFYMYIAILSCVFAVYSIRIKYFNLTKEKKIIIHDRFANQIEIIDGSVSTVYLKKDSTFDYSGIQNRHTTQQNIILTTQEWENFLNSNSDQLVNFKIENFSNLSDSVIIKELYLK